MDVFFNRQSKLIWVPSCAPLLPDLFLYSYETDFIQGLLMKNEKKLAWSFVFSFSYVVGVLSLNNSECGDFVDHIYSIEFEIKDTTGTYTSTVRSASFLLHYQLEIDSEDLRQQRWLKFPIVNFQFISSNDKLVWVFISQLIRFSRAASSYHDFLDSESLLRRKLLKCGFLVDKIKSSLRKY